MQAMILEFTDLDFGFVSGISRLNLTPENRILLYQGLDVSSPSAL